MSRSSFIIALLAASSLLACGGYDASKFDDPPPGTTDAAGNDTSTGGDSATDGGTDSVVPPTDGPLPDTTPPPPGITLDNVCEKLADAICASPLESCCTTHGFGFNGGACKDGVRSDCKNDTDAVKAGAEKFDAGKFGACAEAWKAMTTKCSVPILEFIKYVAICDGLFAGTTPPGGSCTRDNQCQAPPGAWGNCNESGRCEVIAIVGKDAACNYGGTTQRFCDSGLYCAIPGTAGSGTCKPAKPPGSSCGGTWDSSCGFGNACITYKCGPGLPKGGTCYDDLQCASWNCAGGSCTDPNVQIASKDFCGGG